MNLLGQMMTKLEMSAVATTTAVTVAPVVAFHWEVLHQDRSAAVAS